MEVILKENVGSLGFIGDVVRVKPGYARNYLIPKKLAVPASRHNVLQFEHYKKLLEVKRAQKKVEADELKKRLESIELKIEQAAGENERLFGSVTTHDIQKLLKDQSYDVDRKLIRLEAPIKTLGVHDVEIKLHQDVSAKIKIHVEAQGKAE